MSLSPYAVYSSLAVRMEDESGSVLSLEHGRSSPWAHAQSSYCACAVSKVPDESCACVYAVSARIYMPSAWT